MSNYDVLICPATSLASVPADVRYPNEPQGLPIPEYYRWLAIAYASTVMALPVITLPVGTTDGGPPFAIQLIGKPIDEAALFQIAHALEKRIGRDSTPIDPK